ASVLEGLTKVQEVLQADSELKDKVNSLIDSNLNNSQKLVEVTELLKRANLLSVLTFLEAIQGIVNQQHAHHTALVESFRSLTWNLGHRLTKIKETQADIHVNLDTLEIKSMVSKIYQVFKGSASFTPSVSATYQAVAPTEVNALAEGEKLAPAENVKNVELSRIEITKVVDEEVKSMDAPLKEVSKSLNLDDVIPLPLQDLSLPKKKKKVVKLEPESYITGLHCNRALPEGVKFKENRVTEEPEFGLMFMDEFGDLTFQRVSDIDKVKTTTLFSYKMMELPGKSPTNKKFVDLMDKMIQERLDKHTLLIKKSKLELIGIKPEE
nr:protein kinase superfamily protein [Tanacetum cinerariifolium]